MVGAPDDDIRIKTLMELLEKGYADQIMMSHDTVNYWMGRPLILPKQVQEKMKNWHPAHLFENVIPALRDKGVQEEDIRTMTEKILPDCLPVWGQRSDFRPGHKELGRNPDSLSCSDFVCSNRLI